MLTSVDLPATQHMDDAETVLELLSIPILLILLVHVETMILTYSL